MNKLVTRSLASAFVLGLAAPAFAQQAPWFATDGFKAKFPDWSAKFVDAHTKLKAAQADLKKAQEALRGEKDKARRAELAKAAVAPRQAAWDAETAWLKLHQEWKKLEVERNAKDWDARIAAIKEAMEKKTGVAKELLEARLTLWKAELAWIEANRAWRKVESEFHLKRWQEQIAKIAAAMAKAK